MTRLQQSRWPSDWTLEIDFRLSLLCVQDPGHGSVKKKRQYQRITASFKGELYSNDQSNLEGKSRFSSYQKCRCIK